jgi:hypothetical protein
VAKLALRGTVAGPKRERWKGRVCLRVSGKYPCHRSVSLPVCEGQRKKRGRVVGQDKGALDPAPKPPSALTVPLIARPLAATLIAVVAVVDTTAGLALGAAGLLL